MSLRKNTNICSPNHNLCIYYPIANVNIFSKFAITISQKSANLFRTSATHRHPNIEIKLVSLNLEKRIN